MNQYLCFAATFLAGRYHGKEWPPSPARLFQALVAGARTGIYRQYWPATEGMLRILEQLPAPEIVARNAECMHPYRISVPNNDTDRAAKDWAAGRQFDAASLRTMKDVRPREIRSPHDGQPHVYYFWKLPENADVAASKQLASFLHTLGWGVDMAYADAFLADDQFIHARADDGNHSRYVPAPRGTLHSVPMPGYLDDLSDAYCRYCHRHSSSGVDAFTRSTRYGQHPYRLLGAAKPPVAMFLLRQIDHTNAWFSAPWAFSMRVAAWMRHAVAKALREEGYDEHKVMSMY